MYKEALKTYCVMIYEHRECYQINQQIFCTIYELYFILLPIFQ